MRVPYARLAIGINTVAAWSQVKALVLIHARPVTSTMETYARHGRNGGRVMSDLAERIKQWQEKHALEFAAAKLGIKGCNGYHFCLDCPTSERNYGRYMMHGEAQRVNPFCCHAVDDSLWWSE
jgi:hypothetical protein